MTGFRRLAVPGVAFCACMVVAHQTHAQTVLLNSLTSNSATHGDMAFSITNCLCSGGSCSADNAAIPEVLNGGNGTEIESSHTSGSAIYRNKTGASNTSLDFTPQAKLHNGGHGQSAIQDVIAGPVGTAHHDQLVSPVLNSFPGATASRGSVTSTIATASNSMGSALTTAPASLNVSLNVGSTSATPGSALKLTSAQGFSTPAREPASIALLASGLVGLTALRSHYKSRNQPTPPAGQPKRQRGETV